MLTRMLINEHYKDHLPSRVCMRQEITIGDHRIRTHQNGAVYASTDDTSPNTFVLRSHLEPYSPRPCIKQIYQNSVNSAFEKVI